jgi:hypothetical protein
LTQFGPEMNSKKPNPEFQDDPGFPSALYVFMRSLIQPKTQHLLIRDFPGVQKNIPAKMEKYVGALRAV